MPFIHIQSLPFVQPIDVAGILTEIVNDFAAGTGVDLEHVHATWHFIPSGHYVVAGMVGELQPKKTHPVLVDILTPDFNSAESIEKMLRVVAQSLKKHAYVPLDNVFINHRYAQAGRVFDAGDIVRW